MKKIVMLLALIVCCSANAENCFDAEILKIVDGDTLDARVRLEPFSLLKELRLRPVSYTPQAQPTKSSVYIKVVAGSIKK